MINVPISKMNMNSLHSLQITTLQYTENEHQALFEI